MMTSTRGHTIGSLTRRRSPPTPLQSQCDCRRTTAGTCPGRNDPGRATGRTGFMDTLDEAGETAEGLVWTISGPRPGRPISPIPPLTETRFGAEKCPCGRRARKQIAPRPSRRPRNPFFGRLLRTTPRVEVRAESASQSVTWTATHDPEMGLVGKPNQRSPTSICVATFVAAFEFCTRNAMNRPARPLRRPVAGDS